MIVVVLVRPDSRTKLVSSGFEITSKAPPSTSRAGQEKKQTEVSYASCVHRGSNCSESKISQLMAGCKDEAGVVIWTRRGGCSLNEYFLFVDFFIPFPPSEAMRFPPTCTKHRFPNVIPHTLSERNNMDFVSVDAGFSVSSLSPASPMHFAEQTGHQLEACRCRARNAVLSLLLVLKTDIGREIFDAISRAFVRLFAFALNGAQFVFGSLAVTRREGSLAFSSPFKCSNNYLLCLIDGNPVSSSASCSGSCRHGMGHIEIHESQRGRISCVAAATS